MKKMPTTQDKVSKRSSFKILGIFFCLLFLTYGYFFQAGSVNENSRLDQTRAICELGQFNIDPYAANSEDILIYGEKIYPNKTPGLSLLAVPAWWFLRHLLEALAFPRDIQDHLICYLVIWTTVGLLSALGACCLYGVLEILTANSLAAAMLTLAYALGTIAFPFSTLFFSHQATASLLLISFAILFAFKVHSAKTPHARGTSGLGAWTETIRSDRWLILSGFCCGYAITTELPAALAAFPICLYALFSLKTKRSVIFFAGGFVLGAAVLVFYNLIVYKQAYFIPYAAYVPGSSIEKFSHVPRPSYNLSRLNLSLPKLRILWGITFGKERGLFYVNPWLAALLPGLLAPFFCKRWRAEMILSALVVLLFAGFNSSLGNYMFSWGGGHSVGPRFMIPMLPFAVILIAALTDRAKLGWILLPLGLVSAAVMLAATAVDPRVPYTYHDPILQLFLRNYLTGRFAVLNTGVFGNTFLTGNSVAFNLGKLVRLDPCIQLVPLGILWIVLFRKIMKIAEQRQRLPKNVPVSPTAFRLTTWTTVLFLGFFFLIPVFYKLYRAMPVKGETGLEGTYVAGIPWENPKENLNPRLVPKDLPANIIIEKKVDKSLNFNWLEDCPPLAGQFSVEWNGFLLVEKTGEYVIATLSDDGSCVYLNGQLIINNWGDHAFRLVRANVFLNKGRIPITVRYYNNSGGAVMKLLWAFSQEAMRPVPPGNLRIPSPARGPDIPKGP
jgi:hypothetical protein